MSFSQLAKYLDRLEKTSSRIEITRILADLLSNCNSDEIQPVVYLVLGRLAPSYKSIVFNLADKLVLQSISKAYAKQLDEVQKLYKQKGDLGDVALDLAKSSKSKLSVVQVYEKLIQIAEFEGDGSVEKKVDSLAELLKSVDPMSAKYIARIPVGKLRLGFSDLTLIDALSWMVSGDKSNKKALSRAYEVLPDIGLLAKEVAQKGIEKATKNPIPVLGVPVMPMLAQRVKSAREMIEKMGQVTVEPKYDGLRVLIHFKRGKWVKAYTRNLNDISQMFPELDSLKSATSAKEFILDSEAVGLDEETKKLADFQTTMKRRRKHDISDFASKTPLVFNIFDILFLDGKGLMDKPYLDRREILQKTIKANKSFKTTPYEVTQKPSDIEQGYDKYIAQGLEGIMVKKADTPYIPGRTGYRWVKMKQTESATGKLSDTLDCVILGFTSGQGKRTSFGIGQFLAGVRKGEKILSVTKVGTGLSDEQFKELAKRLKPLVVDKKPENYEVHKDLNPDFWVKPEVVVELAGDDLTKSPKHTAGYALRFPRLVKFRDDKSVDQITTVKEVQDLYKLQYKK